MFAFLAAHRAGRFSEEEFADLFPSGRGRPSIPATRPQNPSPVPVVRVFV
jgi:hypothetical protein